MKLTNKQELFIQYYMISLNATTSYNKAGYVTKNDDVAAVMASRLLRNDKVKTIIEQRLAQRALDNGVTSDMVLKDLLELKDKCLGRKPVRFSHKNKDDEYEIIEKTIFDANGAKASLELLGKHLKLFTEKIESENVNTNISIKIDGEEFD